VQEGKKEPNPLGTVAQCQSLNLLHKKKISTLKQGTENEEIYLYVKDENERARRIRPREKTVAKVTPGEPCQLIEGTSFTHTPDSGWRWERINALESGKERKTGRDGGRTSSRTPRRIFGGGSSLLEC